MIRIVNPSQKDKHRDELDQMHRIRAAVFHERLGWDVTVVDGREVDHFDDEDPVYVLSIDPVTGAVQGSVRLLMTTGPNMLRDVFPQLLPQGQVVDSPIIWESSRFSIDPQLANRSSPESRNKRLNIVTLELLCGIVEVCQAAGIQFVVSVYDARMARIFKAANCAAEIIGEPQRIGKVMTYAGLFATDDEMLQRLRLAGNLPVSVLEEAHGKIEKAA
ncbi:acyl-homoserine-lactone synthase [Rhizobium sp. NFR03]|uniref:acyl-homoserine-lactone synthase n=1 Tax=Rhizobium sp. NFR03 TaxID=1566263 RepID=UPI0008CAD6AB|nr:acyl-homoserine-lactone synthase [Rhizobium sp. NFR03]SES41338.1 acyl homoserine lactone synthase [Rhizobium sp. NFR03]